MVAFRITFANQLETMTCLSRGKVKVSCTSLYLEKEKLDKMEYALTSEWYQELSDFWAVSNYSKRFVDLLLKGCFIHQSGSLLIYTEELLQTTHPGILSGLRPSIDREEQPHIPKPWSSWSPGLVGDIPAHGRVLELDDL